MKISPGTHPFSSVELKILSAVAEVAIDIRIDTYAIGGYVRDKILDRPIKDIDIVCVGDGISFARQVSRRLGVKQPAIFRNFGTAMIMYEGMEVEFVGARKESYNHSSRKPSVSEGTLQDDQNRRDFTVNAMAISLNEDNQWQLLDPFGGLEDMKMKLLRTPLDPDQTFSDDPLRMMRAVRFSSQLGFQIDEQSFFSIKKNRDRINIVSQERITKELNLLLQTATPSAGLTYFLESGLCEITFPELYDLRGAEYREGKGHKDNYFHTLQVLDNVALKSQSLWLRWAALLHDIGKPPTKRFQRGHGWTFHGHDAVGAAMVPRIFKKLKLPLDQKMKYVQKLVLLHLRPISLTKENITDSAIRRLLFEAGEDLEDLMILCKADITTKNKNKMRRYLSNYELVAERMIEIEERDHIRNWQPPITGEEIMQTFGIPPSREVGVIKNAIKEAILDGEVDNNYDAARAFMFVKARELGLADEA